MTSVVLFAGEPSFTPSSMCNSLSKSFGNAYSMTKKNQSPESFCEHIVQSNMKDADFVCPSDELISGCITQIEKLKK